jgi:hypothetical protein
MGIDTVLPQKQNVEQGRKDKEFGRPYQAENT